MDDEIRGRERERERKQKCFATSSDDLCPEKFVVVAGMAVSMVTPLLTTVYTRMDERVGIAGYSCCIVYKMELGPLLDLGL